MKKFLRKLAFFGIGALSLSVTSAKADLFNYSYTFGIGNVVSGSFTGTANGVYVDNIANVSAFLNGNPLAGSPSLFHTAWNTTTNSWDNTIPAVVSTNALFNNFLFIDADFPSSSSYTNYFLMVNDTDVFGDGALAQVFLSSGLSYTNDPVDPSRWSLTAVANPVPEPETYAMLLAGLGILGWHARRRKLKLAA